MTDTVDEKQAVLWKDRPKHHDKCAWRNIKGQAFIYGEGRLLHTLNGTASFIWEKMENGDLSVGQIIDLVVENFHVEIEQAERDCLALLMKMKELELVTLQTTTR